MADYNSQQWREVTERWGRATKEPKWKSGPDGRITLIANPSQILKLDVIQRATNNPHRSFK
jgi:hypothetical protein